jgi:hypothetical protein
MRFARFAFKSSAIADLADAGSGAGRACCFVILRAGPTREIIKSRLTIPN